MGKIITERNCPICDSKKNSLIYRQNYAENFFYNIVSCKRCGFLFVNNILSQKYFDKYYKEQSKYEGVREHETHEKITSKEIIGFLHRNLKKNIKILDVGSSTGSLLWEIKKNGYKNLFGIDPAPKCREIAKNKYGLNIETTDLITFSSKTKFDFIILSQVLEHLVNLRESIDKLYSLLNKDGYLFIGVPDAGRFHIDFQEPFGEFSPEHINFFTESTLSYLMGNFTNVLTRSDNTILISIWRKNIRGEDSITRYVKNSRKKLINLKKKIDSLPKKIIVWGVGELTKRLLLTTDIKKKILFFIDSDPKLINKSLAKINIYSFTKLKDYNEPILISSFRYKSEIIKLIKKLGYRNKIISFKK